MVAGGSFKLASEVWLALSAIFGAYVLLENGQLVHWSLHFWIQTRSTLNLFLLSLKHLSTLLFFKMLFHGMLLF